MGGWVDRALVRLFGTLGAFVGTRCLVANRSCNGRPEPRRWSRFGCIRCKLVLGRGKRNGILCPESRRPSATRRYSTTRLSPRGLWSENLGEPAQQGLDARNAVGTPASAVGPCAEGPIRGIAVPGGPRARADQHWLIIGCTKYL